MNCPVCFEEPEVWFRTPCEHVVCGTCRTGLVDASGQGNIPCPTCRVRCSGDEFVRIYLPTGSDSSRARRDAHLEDKLKEMQAQLDRAHNECEEARFETATWAAIASDKKEEIKELESLLEHERAISNSLRAQVSQLELLRESLSQDLSTLLSHGIVQYDDLDFEDIQSRLQSQHVPSPTVEESGQSTVGTNQDPRPLVSRVGSMFKDAFRISRQSNSSTLVPQDSVGTPHERIQSALEEERYPDEWIAFSGANEDETEEKPDIPSLPLPLPIPSVPLSPIASSSTNSSSPTVHSPSPNSTLTTESEPTAPVATSEIPNCHIGSHSWDVTSDGNEKYRHYLCTNCEHFVVEEKLCVLILPEGRFVEWSPVCSVESES
ncbi:hypothetical protein C8Q75DRAFT_807202 [Abortiporus biennis]|nr:hypothetical protein C8Q75DRAFT_807202 [Abortiporus biennis]